jgi:hypothetical protein
VSNGAEGEAKHRNAGLDGKTYDLQGREVEESYRGIIIRDGKKTTNQQNR